MTEALDHPIEDPLHFVARIRTKLHSAWLGSTYPFGHFGMHVSIHHSCEISRKAAPRITVEDNVYLAPDVWLNVPEDSSAPGAAIWLGRGCKVGRRSMISARNLVRLEADVLLSPSVLIMDHKHEYCDPESPIHSQGTAGDGSVIIERNCWIGYGAAIVCARGKVTIGRNSVVGANAVVTRSFPPHSVIVGNPAKLVRKYDPAAGRWVPVTTESTGSPDLVGRAND